MPGDLFSEQRGEQIIANHGNMTRAYEENHFDLNTHTQTHTHTHSQALLLWCSCKQGGVYLHRPVSYTVSQRASLARNSNNSSWPRITAWNSLRRWGKPLSPPKKPHLERNKTHTQKKWVGEGSRRGNSKRDPSSVGSSGWKVTLSGKGQ